MLSNAAHLSFSRIIKCWGGCRGAGGEGTMLRECGRMWTTKGEIGGRGRNKSAMIEWKGKWDDKLEECWNRIQNDDGDTAGARELKEKKKRRTQSRVAPLPSGVSSQVLPTSRLSNSLPSRCLPACLYASVAASASASHSPLPPTLLPLLLPSNNQWHETSSRQLHPSWSSCMNIYCAFYWVEMCHSYFCYSFVKRGLVIWILHTKPLATQSTEMTFTNLYSQLLFVQNIIVLWGFFCGKS